MNPLELPAPIADYFRADRHDGQAVARCFTADGVVKDERKTHVGGAAIEAWKDAASAGFAYVAEPIALEQRDRKVIVSGRVTGSFQGSPAILRYAFVLERGKIASLEITA
jgi:ketosteroid isomerase-like protein